jgi:hypothetical protein
MSVALQRPPSPYIKRLNWDLPTSADPPPPYLTKNVALKRPPIGTVHTMDITLQIGWLPPEP